MSMNKSYLSTVVMLESFQYERVETPSQIQQTCDLGHPIVCKVKYLGIFKCISHVEKAVIYLS